ARWLKDERSPAVRRASAEALGRIGEKEAVEDILAALADETNDRALDHALTYALIEIGSAKETAEGLTQKSPRVRRAVRAALENIPNSGLDAKAVLAELDAGDAELRETAWWVAGRHPQWGDQLASYFREVLRARVIPNGELWLDDRAAELARFATNPSIQSLIAEAVEGKLLEKREFLPGGGWAPLVGARAMARSGLKTVPDEWFDALAIAIRKKEGGLADFLRAARALQQSKAVPAKLTEALFAVAEDEKRPAELRLAA